MALTLPLAGPGSSLLEHSPHPYSYRCWGEHRGSPPQVPTDPGHLGLCPECHERLREEEP